MLGVVPWSSKFHGRTPRWGIEPTRTISIQLNLHGVAHYLVGLGQDLVATNLCRRPSPCLPRPQKSPRWVRLDVPLLPMLSDLSLVHCGVFSINSGDLRPWHHHIHPIPAAGSHLRSSQPAIILPPIWSIPSRKDPTATVDKYPFAWTLC